MPVGEQGGALGLLTGSGIAAHHSGAMMRGMPNHTPSTYTPHVADEPVAAARAFLRYALNNGVRVWVSYGHLEINGWVLTVGRRSATIQDAQFGVIVRVPFADVIEAVEAS